MEYRTTIEIKNSNITEIQVSWSVIDTNALLETGWILLHGGLGHKDDLGRQAKPCFVLGKPSDA